SVSCPSKDACTAVGLADPGVTSGSTDLAERWNGTAWSVQNMPAAPQGGSLVLVSCPTATACTAVGRTSTGFFAEGWNGSAWSSRGTPPGTGKGRYNNGPDGGP